MSPLDVLAVAAELSLGLAGFAGVAVVLGGGSGKWIPVDLLRIRLLLIGVFAVLFASVVPLGTAASGLALDPSLRLGCLVLLGFVARYALIARALRGLQLDRESQHVFDPRYFRVYAALLGVAGIAQALGLASALVGVEPFPFLFVGILWGLLVGALGFVRLLVMRPGASAGGGVG